MGNNRRAPQHNLERERAIWAEKKAHAGVVAQRLHSIGKTARSLRMKDCADTIISDVCEKCEARYIIRTNFCRDRLCPICAWRRSRRLTQRLDEIIAANVAEADKKPSRYISLTLTIRNVPWAELAGQIEAVMEAWRRMEKRIKRAASVSGWVRTFEVIRSKEHGDAHPHFHILMQTPPEYFGPADEADKADKADKDAGLHYHKKDELIEQWGECLRTEYSPSISVNAIKDTRHDIADAVAEAVKYISKGFLVTDMEGLTDAEFEYYVEAVHGVRTWATGGRMKISDEDDIEDFLHDEELHTNGTCKHCGGKLFELREVWSTAKKAYTAKTVAGGDDIGYNNLKSQAHNVNLYIFIKNSGEGSIYVGSNVYGGATERTERAERTGEGEGVE